MIKTPRVQPVVFIACSSETLALAQEIQAMYAYDPFVVEIWVDGVFNVSKTPIEDLTSLVARIDFAIVLITPDDKIHSRKQDSFGPRDNVIFELGLTIGALGRERTVMLVPRGVDVKIPSDLLGVRPIDYPKGDDTSVKSRIGPACTEIRKLINRLGPI